MGVTTFTKEPTIDLEKPESDLTSVNKSEDIENTLEEDTDTAEEVELSMENTYDSSLICKHSLRPLE